MPGQLPYKPSVEYLRKRAKALLKGLLSKDPLALKRARRIELFATSGSKEDKKRGSYTLHDAQLIIARELGYSSWNRLRAIVEQKRRKRIMSDLNQQDRTGKNVEYKTDLTRCSPMLAVRSPSASAQYYRQHLGFEVQGDWNDNYAIVKRDGFQLHFIQWQAGEGRSEKKEPFKGGVYITVSDVDLLFEELKELRAEIQSEPTDQYYGMREFAVRDPDGWILAFATPLKP